MIEGHWAMLQRGRSAGKLVLVVLLAVTNFSQAARAQEERDSPAIQSIAIGFRGLYKVGYWTPITVHLTGGNQVVQGHVEVIVPDGDGVPSKVIGQPLELATGESKSHTLNVRIGRAAPEIRVRLVADDQILAERAFAGDDVPRALAATQELMIIVGPPPDFNAANRLHERAQDEQAQTAVLESVDELPDAWYAYDGVDVVWLTTSEAQVYNRLAPADARAAALDEWVRMGGRLVLSAGAGAEAAVGPEAPLARFLPGRFEGLAPLRQFSLVENYSQSLEPLPLLVDGRRLTLQIPRISDIDGTIEVPGDLPLVVRSTRGFGQITFVGLDLEREPFPGWKGRGQLINRLLDRPQRPVENQRTETGQVSHVGFNDLSGQLRGALDQFEGIHLVSFVTVGGLIGLYALLIGPVDYFLIRRIWKSRPGWAAAPWITFPAMVLGFSALAWAVSNRTKGETLRINQVDLVDVDLVPRTKQQPPLVRGQSWFTLYSPQNAEFDVTIDPRVQHGLGDTASMEQLFSWFGLPGTGIGGMNAGAAEQPLFMDAYLYSDDLSGLQNVPIAIWSTKSFHALWQARGDVALDVQLREGNDQREQLLAGSIGNALGFSLTSCVLIYSEPRSGGNTWAYNLGTIADGETLTLGRRFDPVTLTTYLTPRRSDVIVPYDESSFDLQRIMTMMMFYEQAGGRGYTGLLNRYQQRLDLSDQLQGGRAILVGRGPSATAVRVGDQTLQPDDVQLTYYRFMLPVAPAASATR